jgi:hypothetical protein
MAEPSTRSLARVVQDALDEGCSLAQLEHTLLADSDTADDVAAAWLYAWAYSAIRPSGDVLAARIADDVGRAGY